MFRASIVLAAALLSLTATVSVASETADRSHTLYLGFELTVEHEGRPCPVVWADDHRLEIRDDRGDLIRLSRLDAKIDSHVVMRVGRVNAEVTNFRTEVFDSRQFAADIDAMQQQLMAEDIRDSGIERAEIARRSAERTIQMAEALRGTRFAPTDAQWDQMRNNVAAAKTAEASASASSQARNLRVREAEVNHDTFKVSFEASAPEPLTRAYGILRVIGRGPAGASERFATVKFFKLDRLGSKPVRVSVTQGGLPPGFAVDEYFVNLYVDGVEIPTTRSANRVEVTVDEAQQFFVLQHRQNHPAATMPARILPELLPAELESLVAETQRSIQVDFAIDADGRVTRLDVVNGAAANLSADVLAGLEALRFLPALQSGVPVASEGRFALAEFLH